MTNEEKYKQAFSAIHISDDFSLEGKKMAETNKRQKLIRGLAGVAACVLLIGGSTAAYAADLGGVQRTLQLWLHGEQTEATLDYHGDGSYELDYIDSEGNAAHRGGGGVAIGPDGKERPLTEAEILDILDDPEVEYADDGSVWVYYAGQKLDITDKFDDGICYVKVSNGEETQYMTIKYQDGWASNPSKYPSPASFR